VSKRIMGNTDYVKSTVWRDNELVFSMRVFAPKSIFIDEEFCAISDEYLIF
jgi:hypothetical protein